MTLSPAEKAWRNERYNFACPGCAQRRIRRAALWVVFCEPHAPDPAPVLYCASCAAALRHALGDAGPAPPSLTVERVETRMTLRLLRLR